MAKKKLQKRKQLTRKLKSKGEVRCSGRVNSSFATKKRSEFNQIAKLETYLRLC